MEVASLKLSMLAALFLAGASDAKDQTLTFNKDVAPVIFKHCSMCHRPQQAAPFGLLTYADVKKHATNILSVLSSRFMPPWLPEPGDFAFENDQRLSAAEISTVKTWVTEGCAEGKSSDLPQPPKWNDEWQLGTPDLVLRMPRSYLLSAEGPDSYRNFVIPTGLTGKRYVKGVEFRPDNPKVVHHAFVRVDTTRESRFLEQKEVEPGFPGIGGPAQIPDGHFLGWQPGRVPTFVPGGMAWQLDQGTDIVLSMHLKPTGKPEEVNASLGLYFTDQPLTMKSFRLQLASLTLDIPAGETNYIVQDSFTLPIDVQLLAVLPHAHSLARRMEAKAVFPGGKCATLLLINDWDFAWHSDYRYKEPISLPKGTVLSMNFTYDNSTNNIRNPNRPPKAVAYGPQASDEMAQFTFQLAPKNSKELSILQKAANSHMTDKFMEHATFVLEKNPDDVKTLTELGQIFMARGELKEAQQKFARAILLNPSFSEAHYQSGVTFRLQQKLPDAQSAFEEALRLDTNNYQAHGNLGFIFAEMGIADKSKMHFEAALKINPDDSLSRQALEELTSIMKRRKP